MLYNGDTKIKQNNPQIVPMVSYGTTTFEYWAEAAGHAPTPGLTLDNLRFIIQRDGAGTADTSTNQIRFIGIELVMGRNDNV
jgi:hypothetical protein